MSLSNSKAYVSVIIPTYNRNKCVTRAIDSVLSQTYDEYEIIVVDDGSSDSTDKVLEPYKAKIHYIYQVNAGPAAARNTGIQISKGEWVAFLDSDDIWLPRKLERQLAESRRLNADLCFHDLSFNKHESRGEISSWNLYLYETGASRKRLTTGVLKDVYRTMMTTGHLFITTTLLVKREALSKIGFFREDLRTSEDLELYFRLAAEHSVAYVAEPLAVYSPAEGRHTNRKSLYKDRIRAISIAILERFQANDQERARLGKLGLLQQMKSLAGEYRLSGSWYAASATYLRWGIAHFAPLRCLTNARWLSMLLPR
ncbi:MAG TPA: glycosyltransferase family 2 protein [Syntrophobacteraceae bacterium]|nr:glycosyltransferase family 2 protein [Syntrophobacteraceae bacterium]